MSPTSSAILVPVLAGTFLHQGLAKASLVSILWAGAADSEADEMQGVWGGGGEWETVCLAALKMLLRKMHKQTVHCYFLNAVSADALLLALQNACGDDNTSIRWVVVCCACCRHASFPSSFLACAAVLLVHHDDTICYMCIHDQVKRCALTPMITPFTLTAAIRSSGVLCLCCENAVPDADHDHTKCCTLTAALRSSGVLGLCCEGAVPDAHLESSSWSLDVLASSLHHLCTLWASYSSATRAMSRISR